MNFLFGTPYQSVMRKEDIKAPNVYNLKWDLQDYLSFTNY